MKHPKPPTYHPGARGAARSPKMSRGAKRRDRAPLPAASDPVPTDVVTPPPTALHPLKGKRGPGQVLTNAAIEAWPGPPSAKKKLPDGNNLYVHQRTPGGQKAFRVRLRLGGTEKQEDYTLGNFPQMTIEMARAAADVARELASKGFSPTVLRRANLMNARLDERALFGTIAELYCEANEDSGYWDKKYAAEVRGHLENHIKPHLLWKMPMCTASVPVAVGLVEACAGRSVSIAYKLLSLVRAIANHAIEIGCVTSSPLIGLKPNAQVRKYRQDSKKGKRHYPAILKLTRLATILRDNDNSPACFQVRLCHILIAHTVLRVSNAVALEWDHIDLDNALISLPRALMKVDDRGSIVSDRGWREFHDVVLSPQIVAMLRTLDRQSKYVFFSPYNKSTHITAETMEKHFREGLGLAGLHSPHSWRSSFSTWANNETTPDGRRRFDRDDIELCLDHAVGSSVSQAYNRGVAIARTGPIFLAWAEALEAAQRAISHAAARPTQAIDAVAAPTPP